MHTFGLSDLSSGGAFQARLLPLLSCAKEVRSEMLLRRASLLIWEGFGGPQGGFGGPPVPTFGVLFWLPRQIGRFAPPATPFGPSSELIFDTFS